MDLRVLSEYFLKYSNKSLGRLFALKQLEINVPRQDIPGHQETVAECGRSLVFPHHREKTDIAVELPKRVGENESVFSRTKLFSLLVRTLMITRVQPYQLSDLRSRQTQFFPRCKLYDLFRARNVS